jgi:drug/metabolite transporter (DMT)-like permease
MSRLAPARNAAAPAAANPNPPHGRDAANPWHALGLLAVVILAWGGNYTWIKLALRDVGPWTFNAARYLGATIVVGVVLLLRKGPRRILPQRGERARLALIGLLQGAILTILITTSLMWIESTHTILLIYTNPVWTLLLSAFILGEQFTLASVAGISLGILGIVVLTNPFVLDWHAAKVPGIFCALMGSLAWALGSVLYRRQSWQSTFWQQVFWQLAASGIVTGVGAALLEWNHTITPSPQLIAITVYNVLVPTALAFWCWSQALSRIKASTASQVLLLSPVFAITQSHLLLGEPLSEAVLTSAACVVAGAALTFLQPTARGRT